jgi:hypothetical protein
MTATRLCTERADIGREKDIKSCCAEQVYTELSLASQILIDYLCFPSTILFFVSKVFLMLLILVLDISLNVFHSSHAALSSGDQFNLARHIDLEIPLEAEWELVLDPVLCLGTEVRQVFMTKDKDTETGDFRMFERPLPHRGDG